VITLNDEEHDHSSGQNERILQENNKWNADQRELLLDSCYVDEKDDDDEDEDFHAYENELFLLYQEHIAATSSPQVSSPISKQDSTVYPATLRTVVEQ
jgi:hypothetical protein